MYPMFRWAGMHIVKYDHFQSRYAYLRATARTKKRGCAYFDTPSGYNAGLKPCASK